jgi:hypothetical protein
MKSGGVVGGVVAAAAVSSVDNCYKCYTRSDGKRKKKKEPIMYMAGAVGHKQVELSGFGKVSKFQITLLIFTYLFMQILD